MAITPSQDVVGDPHRLALKRSRSLFGDAGTPSYHSLACSMSDFRSWRPSARTVMHPQAVAKSSSELSAPRSSKVAAETMMQHLRVESTAEEIAGPMQQYASGTALFDEGDKAYDVFKIVSGVVRTCRFANDGRRVIDAFHVCGDVFGFEEGSIHSMSAEAVCDCSVIFYRNWRHKKASVTDGGVPDQFLSYALQSLARSQRHARLLAKHSAPLKVAAFLVESSERSIDRSELDLSMTRQDIADYIGLSIESVSRAFTQLARDALIDLKTSRKIRIKDLSALRGLDS